MLRHLRNHLRGIASRAILAVSPTYRPLSERSTRFALRELTERALASPPDTSYQITNPFEPAALMCAMKSLLIASASEGKGPKTRRHVSRSS